MMSYVDEWWFRRFQVNHDPDPDPDPDLAVDADPLLLPVCGEPPDHHTGERVV